MSLSTVPVVRIGDVVDRVTKGTTPTTHGYQYTKDGVAFVRVENLRNGVIDSSSLTTFISVDADRFLKRSSLEKGDVLVSIAGTIGRTAVVRDQDLPANTNQAVAIIRGASKTFEPVFLRYALESPLLNRLLTGEARGGAMQNISLEDVKNVEVPVPTINRQRQIVAEIKKQFTRLEAGVAGLRRVQANLKRYRAAVLKAACEGKLVPTEAELARQDGRAYETGAQLLERILTERREKWQGRGQYKEPASADTANLSPIPDGWAWASVEQLSTHVQYGSSAKTNEDSTGVPVLRMGNIQDGKLDFDKLKYLPKAHDEFPELLLARGDLLFNRTNSAELVGKTAVFKDTPHPCSFASYLIRVRLGSDCVPDFVSYFINSVFGRAWIANVVSQQVGQANVNGTKLQALAMPLPPLVEQTRIVAEVERRLSIVDELEAAVNANVQRATRLRQSILQRTFEGRMFCNPNSSKKALP